MSSSPSSTDSAGAAVCCMCGDHGLPGQLFRCRSCRVRQQHSYCSELYPRATAYRRCNWCIREPPAQGADDTRHTEKTKSSISGKASRQGQQRGCSSSTERPPPVEHGRPVTKKRKASHDDDVVPSSSSSSWGVAKMKSGTGNDDGGDKKMMREWKTRVRSKAPRYKLLAEVISCYY